MLSYSRTRQLGTSSTETGSPTNLEFPDEDSFNSWFKTENEIVEWNLEKTRRAPNSASKSPESIFETSSKRGRPTSFEWTKYFTCSFGGKSRTRPEGASERTTFRPTRKVGCTARLKFQKSFSADSISVKSLNSHSGHSINDLETWTHSRMSPATRNWLDKAVATGIEWKDIKRMTRVEVEKADFLGRESMEKYGPIEVPDILRIKNTDFNNFRRKLLIQSARLHPDCRQSLSKYAEIIIHAGGLSTIQCVQEDIVSDSDTFFFAFSSNWQVEVLLKYNSLLFLDATHNTCISLEDCCKKAFLYTILVKHDVAGCGIPAAFMVTNSETQYPLARWLNWLREKYLIPSSPKFMIDCSVTEMAAIQSSFENPQIRLCHWHMLRSMRMQVNSKIKNSASNECQSTSQIRKSAIQDFIGIIFSKTIKEFGQIWSEYDDKYRQHEEWIRYLKLNWLKHPEKWWSGNREGMLEININNYIEAWHNVLKSRYLGSYRKQRTVILVHLLLREVLPDYRIKVARVTMGLERRRLADSEKAQLKKCNDLSPEKAASLVRHSIVEVGEAKHSEVVLVKSFTNDGQEYQVSLNQAGVISCCSCSYMTTSKSVCKHMFLVQSVFGYCISYDTRLCKSVDFCETSLPDPTPEMSTGTEARLESGDRAKALYLERVGYVNSLVDGSKSLNDDEREALNYINAYMDRIKRCGETTDSSWSKRQRR